MTLFELIYARTKRSDRGWTNGVMEFGNSSGGYSPSLPYKHEHSSPRTFLLRRSPRWNHGSRAQYSLWHPAAGGERTGGPVGGVSRCHTVSAPTFCPGARGRKTVPLHPTVLFKS